jgi:PadR family transcriptional regulator, regulatory protein PadR
MARTLPNLGLSAMITGKLKHTDAGSLNTLSCVARSLVITDKLKNPDTGSSTTNTKDKNLSSKESSHFMAAPFEHMVLLAVHRLQQSAYGAEVWREVANRLGREPALAQVYIALRRLEDKGWLTSMESPPTSQKGGRRKKIYHLSATGIKVLEGNAATLTAIGYFSKDVADASQDQGTAVPC